MSSDRRNFLKKGALAFLASGIIPFKLKAESQSNCDPTTTDILGPFFSEGAPQASSIVPDSYEGEKLILTGRLISTDCEMGIADAVLDFWQADENGDYDNENFNFRGKIITDSEGYYNLETIIPGKYLNGSQYRPAHIHLKVQAEGYEELVTQIYFEGDVDIPNDYWASLPSAINRIIPISPGVIGDWFGEFNIVLSPSNPIGINELSIEFGDLSQNFPNPFIDRTRFQFVLNKDSHTQIEIFNQKGQSVHVLVNSSLPKGRYEFNWEATKVLPGVYTAIWHADNLLIKRIKLIKNL